MSIITTQEREYLIKSMGNLLDEYGYCYDDYALGVIVDEWSEAKADLIQAFKTHPNYLEGQFMIAFDTDYERVINKSGIIAFVHYLQYICEQSVFIDNLPEEINQARIAEGCRLLPNNIWYFLAGLDEIAQRTIGEETAKEINEMMPNIHAHTGEKTSRVINRICTYLGYNKLEGYNKEFAKYADSLSPVKIVRHTILSLNPLDYLTMSFGNSWASCHTIDKDNQRDMPNSYHGQYSSGTISYMLDEVSMVFYTVDSAFNGEEYWNEPKINRQMFHYGKEKLIQGRLYPQSNDGESEEYTINRNVIQKIIADIYGFPNLWTLKRGTEAACRYVYTQGTHYPDYCHFSNCSLSRIQDSTNEEIITIGRSPICIECGGSHDNSESINCCTSKYVCADCGCAIDEDDVCWVGDDCYCRDCVEWCEICEEYHRGESYYIDDEHIYVCEGCFDYYFCACEDCGKYIRRDDAYWCDSEHCYICDRCFDNDYGVCNECGEIFHLENLKEYDDELVCADCYEDLTYEEPEEE